MIRSATRRSVPCDVLALEARRFMCAGHEPPAEPPLELAVAPTAVGDPAPPDLVPVADAAKGYVYGWALQPGPPGRTYLALDTAVFNRGSGPIDIRTGALRPDGTRDITQRVYNEGGGFTDRLAANVRLLAGRQGIPDFLAYRLRAALGDGSPGGVVAETVHDIHCLTNTLRYDPAIEDLSGLPTEQNCFQLKAGYLSAYPRLGRDQFIDVSFLSDGHYWLEIEVDPNNRLVETDDTNNVLRLPINIDLPPDDAFATLQSPPVRYSVPLDTLDLRFDQPMDRASFSLADDIPSFWGPGGADLRAALKGFEWTSSHVLRLSFEPQSVEGNYTLTVGPNVLAAKDGRPMDQDRDEIAGEAGEDAYTATARFEATLGPDAFGYEASAIQPETIDLVRGGPGVITLLGGSSSAPLDLGTNTFSFYGTTYSARDLWVNGDGTITFGGGGQGGSNTDLLTYPANATIAPLWANWERPAAEGEAILGRFDDTDADGDVDRLVVEWTVRRSGGVPVMFQAILQLNTAAASGTIIYQYGPGGGLVVLSPSTTGIKDAGSDPGRRLVVQYDERQNPMVANGRAILVRRASSPAQVVGRHVFYNNSAFDGRRPAADAGDDAAIAPDKVAALPGGRLGVFQMINHSRGLNGIMVDVAGLPADAPGVLGAADFRFRTGRGTNLAAWTDAAAQPTVSVRRGAGPGASDRVTLVWPDGAVRNTWLEVTVLANDHTGLAIPHLFYFGNLVGDTDSPWVTSYAPSRVDALDLSRVRAARPRPVARVPPDNRFDVNRDGVVDVLDEALLRRNFGATLPQVDLPRPAAAAPTPQPSPVRRRRAAYEVMT